VASIRIYFEGAKFLPSQGWDEASARKAESGVGVLGEEAARPLPTSWGVLGSAMSSPSEVRGI